MRPAVLLLSLVAFSLFSCSHGPAVTYCIVGETEFACSDPKQRAFTATPLEVDDWGCLSPSDQEDMLSSCQPGEVSPVVEYCVVGGADRLLYCPNRTLTLRQANNWACTSPRDVKRLLEHCKKKRAQKTQ